MWKHMWLAWETLSHGAETSVRTKCTYSAPNRMHHTLALKYSFCIRWIGEEFLRKVRFFEQMPISFLLPIHFHWMSMMAVVRGSGEFLFTAQPWPTVDPGRSWTGMSRERRNRSIARILRQSEIPRIDKLRLLSPSEVHLPKATLINLCNQGHCYILPILIGINSTHPFHHWLHMVKLCEIIMITNMTEPTSCSETSQSKPRLAVTSSEVPLRSSKYPQSFQ